MVSSVEGHRDRREREAGPGRGPSVHLIWLTQTTRQGLHWHRGRFKLVQEPKISLDPRPLPPT